MIQNSASRIVSALIATWLTVVCNVARLPPYAHAYDCTDYRFPFVLGGDSGSSEITQIATEQRSGVTSLYFAGTSSDA